MPVKKTKLNGNQLTRLINVLDIKKAIKSAYICQVKDTCITKIAINYNDGDKESYYPMDDDLDFIVNGIELTRNN